MTVFNKALLYVATMICAAANVHAADGLLESFQIKFEDEMTADSIISAHPDLKFERIIPPAPNKTLEARHRESGLHLWYKVEVPSAAAVTKEVKGFSGKNGIRYVRPTQRIMIPHDKETVIDTLTAPQLSKYGVKAQSAAAVNDPLYDHQWHYASPDCANINLEKAWQIETGKRNVIVAVMDGQIDYTHPDLAVNMWVNEAELNGQPGVDDDGNGYVDDIHGLTFFEDGDFSNHATHIAGTIAAVNNNGTGVCGIAGGNGTTTGVRVMSIGINNGSGHSFIDDWSLFKGFIFAADNGAVISSNSWCSVDQSSPVAVEAINYFIKNAGKYDSSPMNGGLVVFAAGNENSEIPPGPINNPEIDRSALITVSALSSSGLKSSFSNFGYWVDIAAPGGDYDAKGIYSTYPGGKYGFMNGTSMACPHVSGVAALVVSKFQGSSLTPQRVKRIILDSSSPIDPLQTGYSSVKKVGHGLLNAYSAMQSNPEKAPGMPSDISMFEVSGSRVSSYITKWKVPADANGNAVAFLAIYEEDSDTPILKIKTSGCEPGQEFSADISSTLLPDRESFRFKSIDLWGNESPFTDLVAVHDEKTDTPVIFNAGNYDNILIYRPNADFANSPHLDELALPYIAPATGILCSVEDPNGVAVYSSLFSGKIHIEFDVNENTPLGTYPFTVRITDRANPDNSAELTLSYTVREKLMLNEGPKPIAPEGISFDTGTLSGSLTINLRDYIYDPQGLEFVIPDEEDDLDDGFFTDRLHYTVKNDVLDVDYSFIDDGFNDTIEASVGVHPYNSYFVRNTVYVNIRYHKDSGISDIVWDENLDPEGIYTLTGVKIDRPVDSLLPGFYIINGKKTFVR